MKLIYKGRFDGHPETMPQGPDHPGAVAFREADTLGRMALQANGLALAIMVPLLMMVAAINPAALGFDMAIGALASLAAMLPHELLHALVFRDTVYLYVYLSKGMAFVYGTEPMSRGRFVLMSLLPNIVLGLVPLAAFVWRPQDGWLGIMAVIDLGGGAGDYLNAWHALTQMPTGTLTYMKGMGSYWYMPAKRA